MKIEKIKTDTEHEEVTYCEDSATGLMSIIAIHSTVLGPSLGGVRMWPYHSRKEALYDVLRLSRAMTFKASVSGLDLGGGKAVIIADPTKQKSPELLEAFGKFVESRRRRYITAKDVGTTTKDLEIIARQTKNVGGLPVSKGGSGDPSPMTGFGVYQGVRAAVKKGLGLDQLRGVRVAIQGMGHVGYNLAKHLHQNGAKLFVADVHPKSAERAARELGATVVSPSEILEIETDVLAPCAMGGILNPKSISKLKTNIIAGGANNQLEDEWRDGDQLLKKGILYAPDYVINAGGIINIFCENGGYNEAKAKKQTESIYRILLNIFETSEDQTISTPRIAKKMADDRINRKS